MRAARSVLVWIGIAVSTVLFGVPAIVAAFVPPRGDWFLRFARGWARTILAFSGVRVRVLHAERLAAGGGFVVASNHESFADILVLLARLFSAGPSRPRASFRWTAEIAPGASRPWRRRSTCSRPAAASWSFPKRPARAPGSSSRSSRGQRFWRCA